MIGFCVEHSTFDNIFELANVAWPTVIAQRFECALAKARKGRPTDLLCQGATKVMREEGDIFGPCPKWRNGHHSNAEAVEQVVAKSPGIGRAWQVNVRGTDHPDVDPDGCTAANTFELAVFDGSKNFFLHRHGCVGDLVQEEATAVCQFESAGTTPCCSRKRARLVAEQLALKKSFCKGGAVEFCVRPVPPRRQEVQSRCDQFLACAAFPNNENRAIQSGQAGYFLAQR